MSRNRPFFVMLLLVGLTLSACSGSRSTTDTGGGEGPVQDQTTTTIQRTTTTLAPASWEAVNPSEQVPGARFGSSLTYVETEKKSILFGGWDGGSSYLDDMWSYDATNATWEKLALADTAPGPRASHAVAYDPIAVNLVMFGGYDGAECYDDTWVYDIAQQSWSSPAFTGPKPPARYGHSMAYDPTSKNIVLFGGFDGAKEYDDTWAYDPVANTWTNLRPDGDLPTARDSQAMVYDPDNEVMVLFGGWSTTTTYADTWTYDPSANTWTLREPAGVGPASRALHRMVYDPSIKKIVVFGGGTSSATFNDSWLLDLTENTWAPAMAAGGPPPARAGHAMTYDPQNRQILVFGGSNGVGTYFNDLWGLTR